jgi:tetratricopeptide (TPR) repeat protein
MAVAWAAGAIVLALAWGVAFRERVIYSPIVGRALHRPGALISPSLAWQVLQYHDSRGDQFNTIAGEAASLLAGSSYRVMVIDPRRHRSGERDAFTLEGFREGAGLILKARMVFNPQRKERVRHQLETHWRPPDKPDVILLGTPLSRFLPNPFVTSRFSIGVAVPADASMDLRTLLSRLVLRHAVAMTLYFDGDSAAGPAFEDILSLGRLLPADSTLGLADVYRGVSHYFATQGRQLDKAIAALDLVHRLSPGDRDAVQAKAFLLLSQGKREKAGSVLQSAAPDPNDPAALSTLRGEYFLHSERLDSAIKAFEDALKIEEEASYRAEIYVNLALAYGMHKGITDVVRSREMIASLEDAIALGPRDPRPRILQGYAWALGNNAELSRLAFSGAYGLIPSNDTTTRNLYAYWLGRSLLTLNRSPEALDTLTRLVGAPNQQKNDDLLLMFGQTLLDIPGKEHEAELYLDRALELTPNYAKAHRFKGIAVVRRLVKAAPGRTVPDSLNRDARDHLLKAIRFGEERAGTRMLLALLYRYAGDTINAEKHQAVGCQLDPEPPECQIRQAERLVASGDSVQARQLFQGMQSRNPTDAGLPVQEAMIWYKAGRLTEAERANRRALKIEPQSFDAHDNLAFVLFDLGRIEEALSHWERGLRLHPNEPDALAGKAIALQALGKPTALSAYSQAVKIDSTYRDTTLMRREFSWSAKACMAAVPLIGQLAAP